jgi:hypothetical protein
MRRTLVGLGVFAMLALGISQTATPLVINAASTIFPAPANRLVEIDATFTGGPPTASTRLYVDGKQLATVRLQNHLIAAWVPDREGAFELYAAETPDGIPESNELTLLVGTGAKTKLCTGGLLPQSSSAADVAAYMARFDTLNCYYIEPPCCPLEPDGVAHCTKC